MIVEFEQLSELPGELTMVDGVFDPIHPGHLAYFKAAEELGLPVFCNVSSDGYLATKHPPLLLQSDRVQLIDAFSMIAFTHASQFDTETILKTLKPKYYIKGNDWKNKLPAEQVTICQDQGTELVFVDTVLNSSTNLLKNYSANSTENGVLLDAVSAIQKQKQVPTEYYEQEYFCEEWRGSKQSYSVESRRNAEGRHPELIKTVFQPERILDMGCGPGALMYLLREQGLSVDGIDMSTAAVSLAPDEIKGSIISGSIVDPQVEPACYDLVICREVFEHLTLLQVRQVVYQMCRASSKFVYATTRFHPRPDSLFDYTTELDVDPTHINLMNKELLQLLFTLEGFVRRPDLEEKIDWKNKNRVLVYQRKEN